MVITQDRQRSEQQLTHGEKITLLSVPHLIFLKLSNTSENLLHAPSYEIGVALTVEECVVLARDLLCAAASPDVSPASKDGSGDHVPMENIQK